MSNWAGIESGPVPLRPDRHSGGGTDAGVPIRPLRRHARPVIGSLDGAGVIVQRHAREIVLGSVWILLPGVLLNLGATSLAFDRYQTFKGSTVSIPELLGGEKSATGIEELLWYFGLLINSLAACLVGGYVASLVVRHQLGQPLRVRTGYRALLRRLPALVVAWVIGHIWFPFAALVLAQVSSSTIAPVAILAAPLVLVATTRVNVVVAPAIVLEQLGPLAGLRRAVRISRLSFGALMAFVGASTIIGLLVQYGIAYLPRLMQAIGLITFGRFGWLIEGAAGQLGRLISTPLVATATVLVYLEMRMRHEGMDIALDADRAFGPLARDEAGR